VLETTSMEIFTSNGWSFSKNCFQIILSLFGRPMFLFSSFVGFAFVIRNNFM
jgi:hypothetical protein